MRRVLALVVLALAAACGSSSPETLSAPTPSVSPTGSPTPAPIPSFTTPEAAMSYLADAWNRHDLVSLKRVTTPSAREALESMRVEAVNLQLDHCEYNKYRKDYGCSFTHDFPSGYSGRDHGIGYRQTDKPGTALFTVGPARRSGWYMTVLEECG
ncbi:MAG TPA: hypothetical protein VM097_00095 [Mycobacteriales bacterium]|nr:hypothetical protein [Mycobacteriales bacterium]